MSLEDLYREVIIDHYRNPRNKAPLNSPDATADGVNPFCGDEITVQIHFEGDMVDGVSVQGTGCSISQSSASMMGVAIKDKSRTEIFDLMKKFKAMLDVEVDHQVDETELGSRLGELEVLAGVRAYPVRIKCATLAWNTLAEALGDPTAE